MERVIKKITHSIRVAMRGLRYAYALDKSFRLEVTLGSALYLVVGWFLAPFTAWEILVYVFTFLLILIVELLNTAIEKLLDRLHPEEHELIRKSKDIASSASLVAFIFALFVVLTLLLTRYGHTYSALESDLVNAYFPYADLT